MLQAIKKECRLNAKDWLLYPAVIFGLYLLAQVLIAVILHASGSDETWFPLGTVFALMGCAIAALIYEAASFRFRFQLSLSMGACRRQQLLSQLFLCLLRMACCLLFCALLGKLDTLLYTCLYSGRPMQQSPLILFHPIVIAAFLLVPPCLSLFVAGIQSRFGKAGGVVLYFLFLFCCIGLPRISHAAEDSPNSLWGRLWNWVSALPPLFLICSAAAALLLLLLSGWHMLMRARVDLS